MESEIRAAEVDDIHFIQQVARSTWPRAYGKILSEDQLAYMLDELYSAETLRQLIETKQQHFLLMVEHGAAVAFAAYGVWEHETYKLHKLYVQPDCQGKGYGKRLVEQVIYRVHKDGGAKLLLNVNRQNKAVGFYKTIGFRIVRAEDIPIGPFWMNDYVMEMDVPLQ